MKLAKDRFIAGGFSGAVAGIVQDIYGSVTKAIGLTDRTFDEFSETMLNSRVYTGTLGLIVGVLAHLAVSILLGIIFAYIIQQTSSRYHLLKGVGYGFIMWFLLSSLGTIFRLPLFEDIPPGPALTILVGAILYGLVLSYMLKVLESKTSLL